MLLPPTGREGRYNPWGALGTATGFLQLLLQLFEVLGTLLPVFELLLEGFAFQVLQCSFRPLLFSHAVAFRSLPEHPRIDLA
jgi:hypothetical protein